MRLYSLLLRVGLTKDITIVGGIARDKGLRWSLENLLDHRVVLPKEPLFVGSLGAALVGADSMREKDDNCRN